MENEDLKDKVYSAKLRCENCGKIFTVTIQKGLRVRSTPHTCPYCIIESNGHQLLSSGPEILLE